MGCRVWWMQMKTAVVSIILVNYNGADVVLDCLRSLLQCLHTIPYEIIVVDNASTDGSAALIRKHFPTVQLLEQSENQGFGAGNNVGAKQAKGEFLFFLKYRYVAYQRCVASFSNADERASRGRHYWYEVIECRW